MNAMNPAGELIELLRAAGPELWMEATTARARGPGWVVFVAHADCIELGQAPMEVLVRLAHLRRGQALAVALPAGEVDPLPGDEEGTALMDELLPAGSHFVIATRSTVVRLRGCTRAASHRRSDVAGLGGHEAA